VSSGDDLLDALERFLDETVHIGSWSNRQSDLGSKLAVLQRMVELLRLRTGATPPTLSMQDILELGVKAERTASGSWRIVAGREAGQVIATKTPDGWKQSELQMPLLLLVAMQRRQGVPVGLQISGFMERIGGSLSPEDVETTRTGVTRVVTTTRSAARALKLHGLIEVSTETNYKTWQPSVMGILVAGVLVQRQAPVSLHPRSLRLSESAGPFGLSTNLHGDLVDIVHSLQRREEVERLVHFVCGQNSDVLSSFVAAVDTVVAFARDYPATSREIHANRAQANALLGRLRESIDSKVFSEEFAIDLALRDLFART
jgi:hypothetical protein